MIAKETLPALQWPALKSPMSTGNNIISLVEASAIALRPGRLFLLSHRRNVFWRYQPDLMRSGGENPAQMTHATARLSCHDARGRAHNTQHQFRSVESCR
jgi:hypothetical protein